MAIPKNIEEYIEAFPEDLRLKLQALRIAINKAAPDAEEVISYSNPYKIDFEIIKKILTDTVNSHKKPC